MTYVNKALAIFKPTLPIKPATRAGEPCCVGETIIGTKVWKGTTYLGRRVRGEAEALGMQLAYLTDN
jgi:hypothetical protein